MVTEPSPAGGAGGVPPYRNVLLVRLSALGDVVDCLPALDALRTGLPGARLSWLVEDRCAGLLEGHPLLDEVIAVPRRAWTRRMRRPAGLPGLAAEAVRFYARLRHRRFDAVFDFHGNLKSGLHGFLTGAPLRWGLGPGDTREGNGCFATDRLPPLPQGTHRVDRNLALVRRAGIPAGPAAFPLPRDEDAFAAMSSFARSLRAGRGPAVLLHPHASRKGAYKRWPFPRWAELAGRLRSATGVPPAVLWGPGEKEASEELARASGAVLAPPTTTGELCELFRAADCLVGSDSGPMHLAWAAGLPVVALFGPKDPDVYGPYRPGSEVVCLRLDCWPCRRTECPDVRCMEGITVESVFRATERVLAGAPAEGGGGRGA